MKNEIDIGSLTREDKKILYNQFNEKKEYYNQIWKKGIGERIKFFRTARNMSQVQLARLCHVDKSTVCKWEKSENLPSIAILSVIANAVGFPTEVFLIRPLLSDETVQKTKETYYRYEGKVFSSSELILLLQIRTINPLYPINKFIKDILQYHKKIRDPDIDEYRKKIIHSEFGWGLKANTPFCQKERKEKALNFHNQFTKK